MNLKNIINLALNESDPISSGIILNRALQYVDSNGRKPADYETLKLHYTTLATRAEDSQVQKFFREKIAYCVQRSSTS